MIRIHRGEGGPPARLSFCSPLLCLLCLLCLGARSATAGDPFEDALDIDYARQLIPIPEAPRPPVGVLPGFSDAFPFPLPFPDSTRPFTDSALAGPDTAPRLALSGSFWSRELIKRQARFAFAHSRSEPSLTCFWKPAPGLELRLSADRGQRRLSIGDTAAFADAGGTDWGWRGALSFPITPFLIPSVIVGARSSDPDADALEALAFRGAMTSRLSWSFAWGRRRRAYPVSLKVPEYAAFSFPFLLRQDFREAGLAFASGVWEAEWSGRWTEARRPATRPEGYSLDDSARIWRQEGRLAFKGRGILAALDFDMGMGRHVFQGQSLKAGNPYPFSWQRGRQADYSARADLAFPLRRGSGGGWIVAGESEYDALRPEIAFGHYVWDRNGAIDSYQGTLLDLFNDETWLMNGAAYAGQAGFGLWRKADYRGFTVRVSTGLHYLILESNSHLTRRRTAFLFGYTEEDRDRTYPTTEAWLSPTAIEAGYGRGRVWARAGAQAAFPLKVAIERPSGGGGSGGGSGGGKADYRGGLAAGFRIGYSLP
jgi:hypothetical protein